MLAEALHALECPIECHLRLEIVEDGVSLGQGIQHHHQHRMNDVAVVIIEMERLTVLVLAAADIPVWLNSLTVRSMRIGSHSSPIENRKAPFIEAKNSHF